jgi:hypothetical protein
VQHVPNVDSVDADGFLRDIEVMDIDESSKPRRSSAVVISSHLLYLRKIKPIDALEHPAFKNMIDIAACATNGVKLPDRRQTRRAIIDLFKQNLTNLQKRLLVCVLYEFHAYFSYILVYRVKPLRVMSI